MFILKIQAIMVHCSQRVGSIYPVPQIVVSYNDEEGKANEEERGGELEESILSAPA